MLSLRPKLVFLNLTAPIFLEKTRYSSKNLLVRTHKSSVWARNTNTQTASKQDEGFDSPLHSNEPYLHVKTPIGRPHSIFH